MNVQIDKAGRVVLPKRLRERFRLRGGDMLELEVKDEVIQLRPQTTRVRLERINGVLVVVGEVPVPEGRDIVSEAREDRIAHIAIATSEPK